MSVPLYGPGELWLCKLPGQRKPYVGVSLISQINQVYIHFPIAPVHGRSRKDHLHFFFKFLSATDLRCSMQDLVPWPGIESRLLALGMWSLNHWTPIPIYMLLWQLTFLQGPMNGTSDSLWTTTAWTKLPRLSSTNVMFREKVWIIPRVILSW